MKEWYTVAELAGVIGLPPSIRGINHRASNEGWISRKNKARGGGKEIHISSLPIDTQKSLRISRAKQSREYERGQLTATAIKGIEKKKAQQRQDALDDGIRNYLKLNDGERTRSDAKQEIILAFENYKSASGLSGSTARDKYADAYKRGDIRLADWVHQAIKSFSSRTLHNWLKTYNEKGIAALAGEYGKHRKGTGIIDTQPQLAEYVIGMLVEYPHISHSVLLKAIKAHFEGCSISYPSASTLERWVNRWKSKNRQVYTAVKNPDEWKNKYMVAFGSRSERANELNALWEFDSTPADVMLTDGRFSIVGVIDVYSRRVKLVLSDTSNSQAVAQVIRQSIVDWGVPQVAKTDNGSDYTSKYINAVFKRLDIKAELCAPFSAWEKPHIERFFRTFAHDIAELLPGFIGHNVAERSAIEARKQFSDRLFKKDEVIEIKKSSVEFQEFINAWLENCYHRDKHSELKQTPLEMVRAWKHPVKRIEDERVLDILLSRPSSTRTIGKKGIKLDNGIYVHPALAAYSGEECQPYYDDKDMGRIYVYDMFGDFICIAEDPEISGVSRSEVAAKAKEIQREAIQEERRRLKAAAKKVTQRDVAQQILDHRATQARAEKTIEFPKPSETHTGDGIEAAQDALHAELNLPEPAPLKTACDEAAEQKAEKKLAEVMQLSSARTTKSEPTDDELFQRWLTLDKRIINGEKLEGKEADFYQSFPDTPEYKVIKRLQAIGIY